MLHATISLDPAFRIGPVRRRTFGSFIEHIGRCVYSGIHDPAHPTADGDGFRLDVVDLCKELGVSTIRYPGGNFVSGYRWEDGVGPRDQRPVRRDLAWHSTEPNLVGVGEFMRWTALSGTEPMLALNLGTRGVQEALDLLEYCNTPGGTRWSDLRRQNGALSPYNVRMWCLGNEMDGPWQIGHKTAHEYGRLAAETARAMRMLDPELELVVCGSSNSHMDTFGKWERIVLEEAYEHVDLISAHSYYCPQGDDLGSFLASAVDMDHMVESIIAAADYVRATKRLAKHVNISFDEWNVWYQHRESSRPPTGDDWPIAPHLNEDRYSVADAVVVGSLLISLLRHTDRVHAASLAQLVNVIAPIVTEPDGRVWRQTIYHPFAQASRLAAGDVLRVAIDVPNYETAAYGDVPVIDAVATWDDANRSGALFIVNRSQTDTIEVRVDLRAFAGVSSAHGTSFHHADFGRTSSADDDSTLMPRPNSTVRLEDGTVGLTIPPISWNTIRLS